FCLPASTVVPERRLFRFHRLFFSGSADHRDLHSFPTRRSSDLQLITQAYLRRIDESSVTRLFIAACMNHSSHKSNPIPFDWLFIDRKSTRLNSSHVKISYAVFCLKKKKTNVIMQRRHALCKRNN